MNATHTPAPWQLTFGEYDAAIHNDVTIASINDDALAWEANAHLIAAAPRLLESLKDLENILSCKPYDRDEQKLLEIARATIAKAEGKAE